MANEPEFIGQREGEQVELILFKHWFFLVWPILKAILIMAVSFVIPIWLHGFTWIFSYAVTALLYYGWIAFWFLYMFYEYLNWYKDRYIITNERIVNIDQRGLFSRKVSEIELGKIQNLTHSVTGLFATMFDFGTVVVQSAGVSDLRLEQIADPAGVQEEITHLVKSAAKHNPGPELGASFENSDVIK